ncbi:Peroxisome membrane anchor protein Pex14p N-terminal [Penicillium samsonianum]|uniref:Peroxisome membrane anchor protein Pex14p N-terminal n=1 Tax=Penicillium samsonianum TaxID=1882272 RepID=UPI0025473A9A|nr:Peroxisome membrane anchor protein Pex14p N-terminal [Penicillium samsonianum]KAJ6128630.1 Peroxisome membrane anchor protein Pex14p N-terminal [Penicillium samsonianum]
MAPSPGKVPSPLYNTPTSLLSHISGECVRYFIMPDDTSKSSSIPSWQRPNKTAEESPSPTSDDAPATTASTSRQALLDQASKFLEDESIRDAPTERKVSFLESKGLSSDDIEQVLGISRNAEASSSSTTAEDKTQEEIPSTSPTQSEATPSPPIASSSPSNTMSSQPAPAPVPTPTQASRDVPPIITYPEFLFESSKPPPLVTMRNLLYTLYGATGLGASLYGASEYLVKPMLANLTSARHELASTAEANLQKLNEKLEKTVSVIPAELTARKIKPYSDEEDDDASSITSDPTELFHRDVATQTSPEPTPVLSATEPVNSADAAAVSPSTAVNNHVSRVESITSKLREIVNSEKDASTLDDSMRTRLTELHHYCDGLIYSGPTYSSGSTYGVWNSNNSGSNDSTSMRKAEDEAIAGFRADIRGVKGALLSARNFPASRGGRLGGGLPVGGR